MSPKRWREIKAVLTAALDCEPEARSSFLDHACGSDESLRAEVEALIAQQRPGDSIADSCSIDDRLESPGTGRSTLQSGDRLGSYTIVREIERGGVGTVYLAGRSDDQYRQQVAIKVIRRGMDTDFVLRRFRNERQILAALDHPNIARLLDGGTTQDHRPYLVMEYVEGLPLDIYCDKHALNTEQRLRLFQQVCAAVQYAHQRLVIHRDIKPNNILVTAAGVPKLLDFGIAKLLTPELAANTLDATSPALRLMTPAYASPEQIKGEPVTTATDIYSLGVLLHELLTGHKPYRFQSHTPVEAIQALLEVEPARPSSKVLSTEVVQGIDGAASLTLTPESVSKTREGTPDRLRRRLRGDLDNIILTALRKEPQRRYPSAEQLSLDIARHIADQPVYARPDTLGYRFRKLVKRNTLVVAVGSLSLVLLCLFTVLTLLQARQVGQQRDAAQVERNRAEQVVRLLANLFAASNPEKLPGVTELSVRKFLEGATPQLLEELQNQPDVQARMKLVLSEVHRSRSEFAEARKLAEEALQQFRSLQGTESPSSAEAFHTLARLVAETDGPEAAVPMLRESLVRHRRIFKPGDLRVASAMHDLASSMQKSDEKLMLLNEALTIRRRAVPEPAEDIASSLNGLALYYRGTNHDRAEELFRESLDLLKRVYPETHPKVLDVSHNLAELYSVQERLDLAETMYRRVLELQTAAVGPDTVRVTASLTVLGDVLARKGRYAEAEELYRKSLGHWMQLVGPNHWRVANDQRNVARVLQLQGRLMEAVPLMQQAYETFKQSYDRIDSAFFMHAQLGDMLARAGRVDDGLAALRQSVKELQETHPNGHEYVADAQVLLGQTLLGRESPSEAEALFRRVLEYRLASLDKTHPRIAEARCGLASALAAQRRYSEAEPLFRDAFERFQDWGLADKTEVQRARTYWAEVSKARGLPMPK